MSLIYTSTGEKWRGERIGGVAHPRSIEQLWTTEQLAALGLEKAPAPTPAPIDLNAAVNAERDRRIAAGCVFGGVLFQTDERSKLRISGAAQMALGAIINGAQANDFRWHGGSTDFSFTAADNTAVPMDAPTMWAFGVSVGQREKFLLDKARALKDTPGGFTGDPTDDIYWT